MWSLGNESVRYPAENNESAYNFGLISCPRRARQAQATPSLCSPTNDMAAASTMNSVLIEYSITRCDT